MNRITKVLATTAVCSLSFAIGYLVYSSYTISMPCAKCQTETVVEDIISAHSSTYRERVCENCGYVFPLEQNDYDEWWYFWNSWTLDIRQYSDDVRHYKGLDSISIIGRSSINEFDEEPDSIPIEETCPD